MRITILLLFFANILGAQIWKGSGFIYTSSLPVHNPGDRGAWVAIDTMSGNWYEWTGSNWIGAGFRVQQTNTFGVPSYTPGGQRSRIAINSGDSLYFYQSGSWALLNDVPDLTGYVTTQELIDTAVAIRADFPVAGVDTVTILSQDSILIYSVNGGEVGRDTIRAGLGELQEYDDDDDAIASGLNFYDFYVLSENNTYTLPSGLVKRVQFVAPPPPAQDLVFSVQGQSSGTPTNGTVVISATDDIDVESTGSLNIVSVTRSDDAGFRRHDVVISIPNNESGNLVFKDKDKIISYGNHNGASNPNANFYTGVNTTSPILNWNLNDIHSGVEKIRQATQYLNILPTTGNEAMPTGLAFLFLSGANINWTYTGALPTGLTSLILNGNNINWTYTGAMPTGLTSLRLIGNNINWTYTGAMPTGLTALQLIGANINWTYTGAMPTGLTLLILQGANINWTGTTFGRDTAPFPNFSTFLLENYRNPGNDLTSAELITMCQNLMNRCGDLPNITIREYDLNPSIAAIQGATPDEFGTTEEQIRYWIEQVKNKAPGTRTFQLNTTSI
jgi:hypothetical protein